MALGDEVLPIIRGNLVPGASPGRVLAEAADPPATADVLWANGKRTDGVLQSNLVKVFAPETNGEAAVGVWAQFLNRRSDLAVLSDKSPAASGLVVSAMGIGAYDAAEPSLQHLWLAIGRETIRLNVIDDNVAGVLRLEPARRSVI